MKERPILFSAPMVRAILEGRKTQVRRVVKARNQDALRVSPYPRPPWTDGRPFYGWDGNVGHPLFCPYGAPGDRLWVREKWGVVSHAWDEAGGRIPWTPDRPTTSVRELPFGRGYYSGHVIYAADGAFEWAGDDDGGGEPRTAWKPSTHMPRAVSRITLEITDVRVQRLQEISEADAIAEGIARHGDGWRGAPDLPWFASPTGAYRSLWESIHPRAGSWDLNPWVWALTFRRIAQQERAP